MNTIKSPEQIAEVKPFYDQVAETNREYFHYWLEHSFGYWDFWLSLALTIAPWIVWLLVRKKESQGRILIAGLFMIAISSWLDFLGVVLGIWYYSVDVIPTIPSYVPWDFSILPVLVMLFVQFKPHLNPWLKAIGFSVFNSFVGEPLMQWIGLYVPIYWNSFYSFPIYILIYIACHKLAYMKAYKPLKE